MKLLIKKHSKILLLAGVCLFSLDAFSASEATKRMIHDTLSKYCIPPKKENCNPREEGQYDPNYNFCLCEDDGMVYSKSGRKCVEVPAGTYYQKSMRTNIPKKCEPGTYSGSGASSCTSCSPGYYASGYGNTGCEPCPAGKYASGSGNASCSSCWAGSFQPSSGQSTCKSCNSNNCETSDTGATSCYSRCSGNYVCNGSGSCECRLKAKTCYYITSSCTYSYKCSGKYHMCESRSERCYYEKEETYSGGDACGGRWSDSNCKNKDGKYKDNINCDWNSSQGRYECPYEGGSYTERVYEP